MLDENGFERDTAPSRWVMMAIWASVPLAAAAFGLAIVVIFGIQTAAKERDAIAAGLARVRQAELAAPRAAATATEASVPPMPLQIAAEETSGPPPVEPARDFRSRREVVDAIELPSEEPVGVAGLLPSGEDRPPQPLAEHPPAAAALPMASSRAAPEAPLPQMRGLQALAEHSPAVPAPPVAASRLAPEKPLLQVLGPQAVKPPVPQRSAAGEALAALPVPPVEPVETRPDVTSAGPVAPVSNPPPGAEMVRGPAPGAAGLAQDRLQVAPTASVVGPALAPRRVFIHQPTDARGGAAEAVARRLGRQRVAVAAIRPVRATPSAPEIRYFYEADRAAAAGLARQLSGPAWRVRDFASYAKPPRPGTLEIWLPSGMAIGED